MNNKVQCTNVPSLLNMQTDDIESTNPTAHMLSFQQLQFKCLLKGGRGGFNAQDLK